MDRNIVDSIGTHVKEFMGAASGELSKMQESPVGTKPRSKREFSIILKKMLDLPPEEKAQKLQELANLAGHEGEPLSDGCELCKFLTDAILKRK